jgi:hypothetical protein
MKRLLNLNLFALLISCMFLSCSKEKVEKATVTPSTAATSDGTLCENCLAPMDLIKGAGGTAVSLGTVTVCVTGDDLCFRFAASGGGTLGSVKVGIFATSQDVYNQNNTPAPKNFTVAEQLQPRTKIYSLCIPLTQVATIMGTTTVTDLAGLTAYISANAQVSGGSGTPGGQGWAGTLTNNAQYPFDRYFTFAFTSCVGPPPSGVCLFTQGYWFAKPNVVWPGCIDALDNAACGTVTIGGYPYSRAEARAIFSSTNRNGKTDAKQAFLQAAALTLSLANNPDQTDAVNALCPGVAAALDYINAYFTNKGKQTGDTLNGMTAKNATLRASAELISACLNNPNNTCDNNYVR